MLINKIQVKCSTELHEIKDSWHSLEQNSPVSVYQRYDWVSAWYEKLIQESVSRHTLQLQLIHIYKNDQIVAIFPFCIRTKMGIRTLRWLGDDHFNYLGGIYLETFLADLDKSTFEQIWQKALALLPRFDVVWLTHQTLDFGHFQSPFGWLRQIPGANPSHQLVFPHHDWTKLLPDLRSKSTRKRMRNEESRLSREGDLSWKRVTELDEVEKYTDILINQRQERFNTLGIEQESNIEGYRNFYLALLRESIERKDDLAYLMVIELDNEVLASIIVAQTNKKLYLIINSMTSSNYQKWSPGEFLLRIVMQSACDQQVELIDFGLGENSNYKTAWCNRTIDMFETIQGRGVLGKMVAFIFTGGVCLKREFKQSPLLWGWYCRFRIWRQSKNKWRNLIKQLKPLSV